MRIRKSRLKTYHHKTRKVLKDKEKSEYEVYEDPKPFQAVVWPASGKLQAEIYGQKLNYIRNCKVEGTYTVIEEKGREAYQFEDFVLREGDGICIGVDSDGDPDYKVISIKPYRNLYMELEKI